MALTEKDLLEKKQEIDKAKEDLAGLKGEEKALLKQLNDDWGCETLKEARKKIDGYASEITELDEQIEELSTALEEKYLANESGTED